jgi:hypothetical protein
MKKLPRTGDILRHIVPLFHQVLVRLVTHTWDIRRFHPGKERY